MDQTKLVGVGCFGKPERIAKLLNKIFSDYSGLCDIPLPVGFETGYGRGADAIRGFYLGFAESVLNLSLFTREARFGSEKTPKRTTYPLRLKKTA